MRFWTISKIVVIGIVGELFKLALKSLAVGMQMFGEVLRGGSPLNVLKQNQDDGNQSTLLGLLIFLFFNTTAIVGFPVFLAYAFPIWVVAYILQISLADKQIGLVDWVNRFLSWFSFIYRFTFFTFAFSLVFGPAIFFTLSSLGIYLTTNFSAFAPMLIYFVVSGQYGEIFDVKNILAIGLPSFLLLALFINRKTELLNFFRHYLIWILATLTNLSASAITLIVLSPFSSERDFYLLLYFVVLSSISLLIFAFTARLSWQGKSSFNNETNSHNLIENLLGIQGFTRRFQERR